MIANLVQAARARRPEETVFRGTGFQFRQELRDLGRTLRLPTSKLTPYSLRRGGATWHFQQYGSLSRTTVHGRWADERTARIYIDGALAQLGEWCIPPACEELLRAAAHAAWCKLAEEARAS